MALRVSLGRIVLADDPVAADFTCTRLMGLNPLRVNYLAQAAEFLGNGTPERIVQLARTAAPACSNRSRCCRSSLTCAVFRNRPRRKIRECLPSPR